MLTGRILDWTAFAPGGSDGLAADLLAGRARGRDLPDPVRPTDLDVGRWRRMSRLARFAALAVHELLERHPELDRGSLPLIHGSAMGEVVPSSAFLDRLFLEGPHAASPLNFQNSVYNATAAHVSLAYGLRGPAETLSTGMATGLAALARAFEWTARAPAVLVVVGDDLNPTTRLAYANTGEPGECVVAALIGAGADLHVHDGHVSLAPIQRPGPVFARGVALPYERSFVASAGIRPEAAIGLCCANGLLALLACPGATIVDQDDGTSLTAWSDGAASGAATAGAPRATGSPAR
jgi:hypothetical protein